MSTPLRHGKHVDPALMYAPSRVRERGHLPTEPSAPAVNPDRGSAFRQSNGDPAILKAIRRLALEPELVPPPPSTDSGRIIWMRMLRAGGLMVMAAIVAWIVISTPLVHLLYSKLLVVAGEVTIPPLLQTRERSAMSEPARSVSAEDSSDTHRPGQNASVEPVPPVIEFAVASRDGEEIPRAASTFSTDISAPTSEGETPPRPSVPDFVTRRLDQGELASLLQRADGFIKSGDLSAARLLLERAATAGDARAAFTLAGTFDPHVLKALGLRDGAPDISQARLWYERAANLGSADASLRLQQLATTSSE